MEIDFDQFLDIDILDVYETEISSSKEHLWEAYNWAIYYISEAKRVHDELEEYYIPNMDFAVINAQRDEILERIFQCAKEFE